MLMPFWATMSYVVIPNNISYSQKAFTFLRSQFIINPSQAN